MSRKRRIPEEEADALEKEPLARSLLRDLEKLTEDRADTFDNDFQLITEGLEDGEKK